MRGLAPPAGVECVAVTPWVGNENSTDSAHSYPPAYPPQDLAWVCNRCIHGGDAKVNIDTRTSPVGNDVSVILNITQQPVAQHVALTHEQMELPDAKPPQGTRL